MKRLDHLHSQINIDTCFLVTVFLVLTCCVSFLFFLCLLTHLPGKVSTSSSSKMNGARGVMMCHPREMHANIGRVMNLHDVIE